MSRTLLTLAVVAALISPVFAGQIYTADFTSGTLPAGVGTTSPFGQPVMSEVPFGTGYILGTSLANADNTLRSNSSVEIDFPDTTLPAGMRWVMKQGTVANYMGALNMGYFDANPGVTYDIMGATTNDWAGNAQFKNAAQGVQMSASSYVANTYRANGPVFFTQAPLTSIDPNIISVVRNSILTLSPINVGTDPCKQNQVLVNGKGDAGVFQGVNGGEYGVTPNTWSFGTLSRIYAQTWNGNRTAGIPAPGALLLAAPSVGAGTTPMPYADASAYWSSLKVGMTNFELGTVKNTDFNCDYTTNIFNPMTGEGDGLIFLNGLDMFPTSGATFFDGDTNGDGLVNIFNPTTFEGDGLNLLNDLPADTAAAATAHVHYDPVTGVVTLDDAGSKLFSLSSASGKLLHGASNLGLNMTDSAPSYYSWMSFTAFNTPAGGTSLGAIVVPGTPASDLTFQYRNSAGAMVAGEVKVPEPATMALLALGGLGVLARRRRA